ncbi:hypothetical protein EW146_g5680 [Bondarzewia mesenterica]|uniref:Uncharacterized protein n=1 Tax=Bondarzewia mesenterica TaxID=1095465 RepID=A0A4S4LSL1_9AGAM|nr:hypothetical protein EW146_g5680 [Bondarzewia mesenterica]
MDRFLAPHTPEALAHNHVTENSCSWDLDQGASLNEALIAGCASYQAFSRYLSGADLVFVPSSRKDLESVLKRYSYDAIHNIISLARNTLEPGGYSRICHISEKSVKNVLDTSDNTATLLALHRPHSPEHISDMEHSTPRPIRSN